ncbi:MULTISPECIES: DUF5994 family protein [unclassified Nocardioides]|uniref:DUF5994 family protein n=1 Tax=unclassified Nocardioides TaxID=2615069 RepID=UPI0012E396A0|nr:MULTISPECIES: DUF5994 family protein [unclassified Nocardioides]
MSDRTGLDTLDGGWWPRSRDLAVELADLADHFPHALGRVQHAVYSPPDWDATPRRVAVRGGHVELDAVPRDDTHLVLLRTSQRLTLCLLVVPHDFSADQGAEALLAATTTGYAHSAGCLLDTVADQPAVEPLDFWA